MGISNHITAHVIFREATPADLKINDSTLRYGQPYITICEDGEKLSGFHIINESTDPKELLVWMQNQQLYIPVSCIDQDLRIHSKSI